MVIKTQVSLKPYNTFGIDVLAQQFCEIQSQPQLVEILKTHSDQSLFILGGGSNMLLTKSIEQLVLHINIKGISIFEETENQVIVSANAGENWHEFVLWCIAQDFGGIENLSLIPGNVGTAPIQNIGAYGVELKDVFVSCEAIHIKTQQIETLYKDDCQFGYRESIFKQKLKGEYIITSVQFRLTKAKHELHLNYGAIKSQLQAKGVSEPTIKDVSDAVIAIRQSKLPDPKKIGNSGSFFKNPVISIDKLQDLTLNFPEIPSYPVSETEVKVPAGWLIEKAGFKGKRYGNYGVHKDQALVLVNYGDASGKDIYDLAIHIQKTIKRIFDIQIEMEVNVFF